MSVVRLSQATTRASIEVQDLPAFAEAWLERQCDLIAGVNSGVVVLGLPAEGAYKPVARWPTGSTPSPALVATAELALAEGRGVVSRQPDAPLRLVTPLMIDGLARGVVALEFGAAAVSALSARNAMLQLEWGVAGLRERLSAERVRVAEAQGRRADTTLDSLAVALEQARFTSAAQAAVGELALRLACERVAIGFVERDRCDVVAISHSAGFGHKVELTLALAAAMNEAIEQRASILFPPQSGGDFQLTREHERLAAGGAGAVLTVPFLVEGRFAGALLAERPLARAFEQATVDELGAAAALLGPVLEAKRRNDQPLLRTALDALALQSTRLLGPRYIGRKLAAMALALLVLLGFVVTVPYQVVADARVEGRIQRAVVAPFDGYISSATMRAGDLVKAGEELAKLDDRELELERINRLTEREQHQLAYGRALAESGRADAGIAQAQIDAAKAQIGLLDRLIGRARLSAPFAGVVVTGDLSRSIGSTVKRGDVLFQIAPLDEYRVVLSVDESQIADVHEGQAGSLLTTSLPSQPFAFRIERITPVAEARDGRTVFRVEGALEGANVALRPGMEGVAKVEVDHRRAAWIWTRTLVDWLRLHLWVWFW